MPLLAMRTAPPAPAPPEEPAAPDFAGALEIVRSLPDHLEARQDQLRLSNAAMARQIGISPTTVTRLYSGVAPSTDTLILCLTWLANT